MVAPFTEEFTLLSDSGQSLDALGNPIAGSGTTTSVTVTGIFAPFDGTNRNATDVATELIQGQDTVLNNPILYLNPGSPVPLATDRMVRVLTGELFQVEGRPSVYTNPFTGDTPGAIVHLRRITG